LSEMESQSAKADGWPSATVTEFVTLSGKTLDPSPPTTGNMFSVTSAPGQIETMTPGWTFLRRFATI
jgi:hypothetical protein